MNTSYRLADAAPSRGRTPTVLLRAALLLLLPSVAWSLVYHRPKLVLDVLLLWSLEPFLPRWAQMVLRTTWIGLCGAMLLLEWNIYPESYLFYLGMVPSIAGSQQGMAAIAALGLLGLFIAMPMGPTQRGRPARVLAAVLAFYACTVALKVSPWGRENLVDLRLPMLRALQVAATAGGQIGTVSVVGKSGVDVVHGHLHERLQAMAPATIPPKILVVMLESWGESPASLHQLLAQLPADAVQVLQAGHTFYRGSTLPGEVRELCSRLMNFREVGFSGEGCLPRKLRTLGFRTSAFHGYDGFFYYRSVIYPALGFEDVRFRPQLSSLPQCAGAFTGACDDAVADAAIEQLAQPGRQFVYLMSLTAHEPVSPQTLQRAYVRQATPLPAINETQSVNRALIQHIVQRIQAETRLEAPVWIYVAGDHNPPSVTESQNALPASQVPFALLQANAVKTR